MLLEKNITKSAAKSAKNQTARFPLLGILGLVLLFLLLAYFVFSFGETTETEKLRFQVLKNKCLRGETLEAEEANEFCALSRQFEPNLLLSQDCSVFFRAYYQAHLSDFLSKSEECADNIIQFLESHHFHAVKNRAKNDKGIVITVSKDNKTVFEIRIMHSSSSQKNVLKENYFRILYVNASFYLTENGEESNLREDTHIPFRDCESLLKTLNKTLNNPKISHAHKR
jgi:hypothetical protein